MVDYFFPSEEGKGGCASFGKEREKKKEGKYSLCSIRI